MSPGMTGLSYQCPSFDSEWVQIHVACVHCPKLCHVLQGSFQAGTLCFLFSCQLEYDQGEACVYKSQGQCPQPRIWSKQDSFFADSLSQDTFFSSFLFSLKVWVFQVRCSTRYACVCWPVLYCFSSALLGFHWLFIVSFLNIVIQLLEYFSLISYYIEVGI